MGFSMNKDDGKDEFIMNHNAIITLEFNKIRDKLCEYAVSEAAQRKLSQLVPFLNEAEVKHKTKETTEARKILEQVGTPPLPSMKEISILMELAGKDAMLLPDQLTKICQFLTACSRMKQFLRRAESLEVNIADYGRSIQDLSSLQKDLEQSIRNNTVDDNASKELKGIRRKMEQINSDIKARLDQLLRTKKEWFTDGYVSIRNGHYVLPVKKEYKNQFSGSVLDISSTGTTYFMEPGSASRLREELSILELNESNEVRRILYTLTALVNENALPLALNIEAMELLDVIFAKAKLSLDLKAVPATINTNRMMKIVNGRHPLISADECIPLNFTLGDMVRGIVITGPNTGGKTVALKTVGLFAIMAQCGLHLPCESAQMCMNNNVLCDLGDGQSITENLSTFSSHILQIIDILKSSDQDSLILLDELGSGTDPAEGMGIAIAILEELRLKNCLFVATTHYPEVKEYAAHAQGLINARMAFDRVSLKPLYKLEIGASGESCALYIAKRLGLPKHILARAYDEAYKKGESEKPMRPDPSFLDSATELYSHANLERIEKEKPVKPAGTRSQRFQIGDSVMIYPQKKIGIVYQLANEKGEVGVQIQKRKELINHKRIQLKAPASMMYPEDYDFSIVFDSVSNRKARHRMDKGHCPDLEIKYDPK